MTFKIDIDPEQVNKEVAAAILNSVIGSQLKASLERYVEGLGKYPTYANPVDSAVREIIVEIVQEEVLKKADDIRKAIAERLTDEMISTTVTKFAEWLKTR